MPATAPSPRRTRCKPAAEPAPTEALGRIVGQSRVIRALSAFVRNPARSTAMLFYGPPGVGKTFAAQALAADLGCDPDWGGVIEIPSGFQDGAAVKDLLAKLRLRPFGSSPWRVAIINEADRMTEQAEAAWLDGLEHLPSAVLVIFTTNHPEKLSRRFIRRCEVYEFAGDTPEFREAMEYIVKQTWLRETGENLDRIPEGLGLFDLAEGTYSIGLALQQIAPYARTGEPLPPRFCVPLVRDNRPTGRKPAPEPARVPEPASGTTPARAFCPVCRTWIKKGAEAVRSDEHWVHAACATAPARVAG